MHEHIFPAWRECKNYFLVWGEWGFPFHRMLNIIFGFVFQEAFLWNEFADVFGTEATTVKWEILHTMWKFSHLSFESSIERWCEDSNFRSESGYVWMVVECTQQNEMNNSFSSPHSWRFLLFHSSHSRWLRCELQTRWGWECVCVRNVDEMKTAIILLYRHQRQASNCSSYVDR